MDTNELLDRAELRERMLADAATALTSSLSPDEILARLPGLLVPGFAEWCSVYLRTGPDAYSRIANATSNPSMAPLSEERDLRLDPMASAGIAAVIRTGNPELHPVIPEALFESVRDPAQSLVARRAQFRSAVLAPLVIQGEVRGAVTAGSSSEGWFGEKDLESLKRFAQVAAVAVQTGILVSELQRSEERLRRAVGAAPLFLCSQDRELRYTWANGVADGFSVERLLGHTDAEVFPREDSERIMALKRRSIETGEPASGELTVQFGPEKRTFDLTVEAERDDDGNIVGVDCAAYDVTEQRTIREELRTSQERLRLAAAAARLGIFEWDVRADQPVWENDQMYEILGVEPETGPLSRDEFLTTMVEPEDLEALGTAMKGGMRPDALVEVTFRIRRARDGTLRWVQLNGRYELDGTGRASRLLGVMADVTDRVMAEETVRRANEIKDEFLGLVSHELRSPLASVVGHARFLARRLAVENLELQESVSSLVADAERLRTLVENMLVLATLEQETLSMEMVDVGAVVSECVARHRNQFPERRIEMHGLPQPLHVKGNPIWLEQITENLLGNAEKYGPTLEPITVTVSSDGEKATVSVRDEGADLGPEDARKIFDPFYRTKGARWKPGLGLGLTVCKRLVQLQEGEIHASAGLGHGTEFTYAIPLVNRVFGGRKI